MSSTLEYIVTSARMIESCSKSGNYSTKVLQTDLRCLKRLVEKALEETRGDR